jgi:hypothetical protein
MSLSTTVSSGVRSVYDLSFQVSPIILNGGIVANTLGGMMPIIGLTGQLAALAGGVISGAINGQAPSLDDFYARFVPVPGGTVISNAIATFPFANQSVAANAIIEQPLAVSLLMIAPVKDAGGYLSKLAIFTALRTSLRSHNAAGGTYHIATPSFIYTNCIMTGMQDVTSGEGGRQQQIMWQLDFIKPLITENDALSAQNSLISKVTGGQQIIPSGAAGTSIWSSAATAVGSAAQGAVQGVNNIAGAVSNFLTQ